MGALDICNEWQRAKKLNQIDREVYYTIHQSAAAERRERESTCQLIIHHFTLNDFDSSPLLKRQHIKHPNVQKNQ